MEQHLNKIHKPIPVGGMGFNLCHGIIKMKKNTPNQIINRMCIICETYDEYGNWDTLLPLTNITIDKCDRVTQIPYSMVNLREISIEDCKNFTTIPHTLVNCCKILIEDCKNFTTIPHTLVNLEIIEIVDCSVTHLPHTLTQLTSCYINYFYYPSNPIYIPKTLTTLTNLEAAIVNIPQELVNLRSLGVTDDYLPNIPDTLVNLTHITLTSSKIRHIPQTFTQLTVLNIFNHQTTLNIPRNIQHAVHVLQDSPWVDCKKESQLKYFQYNLHLLKNLQKNKKISD